MAEQSNKLVKTAVFTENEGADVGQADLAEAKILLAHGSGGKLYHQLVREVFLPAFNNDILNNLGDGAILNLPGTKLAMTTDSFVVQPLFFPGGDIGRLSVCGTVNDLAMSGAKPLYLSVGFIIEAGYPIKNLKQIVHSMAETAQEAGVLIVTGDTKVVAKGQCDGVYINTAGIGVMENDMSDYLPQDGDLIVVSGGLAEHGMAIMTGRENLQMKTAICSDVAPLYSLAAELWQAVPNLREMGDPTRGGVATLLNEWAIKYDIGINLEEEAIPVHSSVAAACDILGLDPLFVANEGKLLAIVPAQAKDAVLRVLACNPLGKNGKIIGTVNKSDKQIVTIQNFFGGKRIVDMLVGEQLPRIC